MRQGVLPFQYAEEKSSTGMTALSGLMTYLELIHAAGLRSSVERHMGLREGGQGWTDSQIVNPVFPILGVFRLKGQPKRDGSIIVRYCKASQSPVYPIRDAFVVVDHPSCPFLSSSCPLPVW